MLARRLDGRTIRLNGGTVELDSVTAPRNDPAAMSFLQSRTRSAREGFGKPILRKEDARLLVGGGCYSDDVNVPGQAYTCFVRSPHGHARVGQIDTSGALATPGGIPALTGADAAAA